MEWKNIFNYAFSFCHRRFPMIKRTILALVVLWMATAWPAATVWGHYTSGVEHLGERTADFLASPFVAAFDPAPAVETLWPPITLYPPPVPPGMCRWERQVLDSYGRPLLDQNGHPLREYTIGPCDVPPK
jgi:hypothetical protein